MKKNIEIARGERKAELVFKNANIINVFTNEILLGDVAVNSGKIVGIGNYSSNQEIDLKGKYLSPGFIDAHVHIESSKVTPGQFAKAILPRGTTTIIADPHEIANVKGVEGIQYILEESRKLPLEIYLMLPSCVPCTTFESSGAILEADDLESLMREERILGLGEMMDYMGVLNRNEKIMKKIKLVHQVEKIIDGHAPFISGKELNAYVVAGAKTEHECSTIEEMIERLRLGMYIHIREGSAAKNLKKLIKAVNKDNLRRILFCTDDKESSELLKNGSIDHNVRLAIKAGVDPIDCIKIASLNAAEAYGLKKIGAIAPGYQADLLIIDDLKNFHIQAVYKKGELVAKDGQALFSIFQKKYANMENTVNIGDIKKEDLRILLKNKKINIIKLLPNSLITEKVTRDIDNNMIIREDGEYIQGQDIQKIAVIERHKKTGNIGLALIEGFGLKDGAIASTVAHDSHNLIVIGDCDEDMLLAIQELKKVGGGITLVSKGKVLETLSLSIAGLMSKEPLEKVDEKLNKMLKIAYDVLKIKKDIQPFMMLSFMALPVIPKLKLTDKGLFDVEKFQFIDLSI
ncbi:adenine deaminase [Garciella nitratireducens]|uniref:adenine deaminase n=1 Tax=Garciella nitratireducens TaxID=218205 RepID=UPI000DEB6610|nr:adenine deaminase [Garciella nitratireducens]RBP44917.1 adenine deaminase [Garciella nitratireducens]